MLQDLYTAVENKAYVPQTQTPDNPALSDVYIFDTEDENLILKDLKEENFIGKIKDLSKGATKRKEQGLPQEYLYVFQYSCRLLRRDVYKPIDNGIYSSHGCMLSKLSGDEIKAIDLVIKTFGLYSPKVLEMISHSQTPWKEKRVGYNLNKKCQVAISEKSVESFYIENDLNSEEKILGYIWDCIQKHRAFV